jgi:cell division protein FtsL
MDNQPSSEQNGKVTPASTLPIQESKPINPIPADPATAQQPANVEKEMTGFEKATVRWAKIAVLLSGLAAIFVCAQWYEMHEGGTDTHTLAEAAKTQSEKMSNMADAADKIRDAAQNMVTQEQRIADNAQKAMDASNRQSKAALDASIGASRLDQRAWVGVVDAATEGGKVEGDGFGFTSISIVIRNSGKTPALKMSIDCCMYVTRVWSDPEIPDYDSELAKQRQNTAARIREHPEMASAINRLQLETEAAKKSYLHEAALAPEVVSRVPLAAGGIMQKGLERVLETPPSDPREMQAYIEKQRQFPKRLYVVGDIVYSDIFQGTKQHTTTICLVREPGPQSVAFFICPQGRMD